MSGHKMCIKGVISVAGLDPTAVVPFSFRVLVVRSNVKDKPEWLS
jgi:hypothetical protein